MAERTPETMVLYWPSGDHGAPFAAPPLQMFDTNEPFRSFPKSNKTAEVLVKRKKRVLERATTDDGSSSDAARVDRQAERQPRVFRVQQPVVVEAVSGGPEHALRDAREVPSIPAIPTRPPRRRTLPAVVTTFAVQGEATNAPSTTKPAPGALQDAEALAGLLREVDVVLTQIREAQRLQIMPVRATATDGTRTFLTVTAEIGLLRERAEQLRRKEAAVAVKWIRSSIARYGLTPEDVFL